MACPFEVGCANYNTAKCNVCHRIAERTQRLYGYQHYPGFKDTAWYAKTVPYFKLKPLFEVTNYG